ncbi:MAG TPA: ATP-binding protein [Candidatus Contendobacter sp.]|nr:ATP-binding protein [Candidatus Contendobacter sp.]HRZ52302.1 ATP-binding protein [Candidatus Contendobacter sp.]
MQKAELLDLIHNGENSGVEFKLDAVDNTDLAREIVGFANFMGGMVLLGVADDGTIAGVTRANLEEWVMELCRVKIEPPLIPYYELHREVEPGKDVAIVRVLPGPSKPYARVHHHRRTYFIRVGSTSREASRDELERMFQDSGRLHYGAKPAPGATLADLDRRRLKNYFAHVVGQDHPADDDLAGWQRLLINLELMTSAGDLAVPTIDGLLLFGRQPRRFLPQAGIRAIAYAGTEPDYAVRADQDLKAPILPLLAENGDLVEIGLIEQALDFINRNTEPGAHLVGARREDRPAYPVAVLREVIVNAVAHRDYAVVGADTLLAVYADRLEVTSPGRLPNSATVEALKAGFRYARNQTLVNVLRDYRYVDFRGMDIRHKIIPGMRAHNGTEPDLLATEHNFTVRLWS